MMLKLQNSNSNSSDLKEFSFIGKLLLSISFWSLLIVFTLSCFPSLAEVKPSAPPTQTKHQTKPINVQEVKGKSGVMAWVVETHEIPVVSVALAFKNAGSAADPKGLAGLAFLLSSMLDEGAGDWDSQEFKTQLLIHNVELGVNASQDFFQINFRTIKKNVNKAFDILKAILTKPRFDDVSLARVKNQIVTLLEQSLNNEQTIAEQKLNSILYGDHPYAKTVQQILQEFSKVTGDQMRQFMKERFARDQLFISVVGDITPCEVQEYLDSTFGDFPEKASPNDLKDVVLPKKGSTVIESLPVPQSFIRFAQSGIPRTDPNFYPAFLLLRILGEGQYESRLWNEIRENRGLTYDIEANLAWTQHSSVIMGEASTKNKNVKEMVTLIRKTWGDMVDGATQEELDSIKKKLIGSFALNFSSTIKIAKALLIYQIDKLGIDYINKRNEIISGITLADINKVAKSLLNPDQLTFVIVGDSKELSCEELTQEKKPGANKL